MKSRFYRPSALYILTWILCFVSILMCTYMLVAHHYRIWHLKILFGLVILIVGSISLTYYARILLDDNYFYYKGRHPYKVSPRIITRRVPLRDVYMIKWECKGWHTNATLSFACIINETFAIFTFPIGKMMIAPDYSKCLNLFDELIRVCERNKSGLVVNMNGKEFRVEMSDSNYQRVKQVMMNQYDSDEITIDTVLYSFSLVKGEDPQCELKDIKTLFKRVKLEYCAMLLFCIILGCCIYFDLSYIGLIR